MSEKYRDKASDRQVILCPCPAPKRLITSANWISRNDSSNINAILHPENYFFSPRLKYSEKTKGDVVAKQILSRNNCYCRCKNKKLPKPTFFKRPNSCISYETGTEYRDDLKRKSLENCVCYEADDDELGLKKGVNRSNEVGIRHTDQRQKYEEYRQIQEEKYEENLREHEENERYEKLRREMGAGDASDEVDTILGTQNYGTSASNYGKIDSMSSQAKTLFSETTEDIPTDEFPSYPSWSVPDFRREHYFETHDIGRIGKTADASVDHHTCVHQYKLDDRWLPDALNKDSFGRSLCKICSKPMEGSNINLSTGRLFSGDSSISRSKLKNFAEAYKYGLSPTTISLGRGKSNVEVVLKEADVPKFNNYINRSKRPVYRNSLALRHQRMRMI